MPIPAEFDSPMNTSPDPKVREVFKYADQVISFKLMHGEKLGHIETKLKEALEKCGHPFHA